MELNGSGIIATLTGIIITPTNATVTSLSEDSSASVTWDALHLKLKWGLLLHVYGFASLFFVLAFYAFFSLLNLRSLISTRPFMATINGFVCLLGASRAASLFIDPYSVSHSMPKAIGAILWDVGFPCVISAFCLIQLAFLQLTQARASSSRLVLRVSPTSTLLLEAPWAYANKYLLNLGPEKLRRKSCLSVVVTAHFSCIIGADITMSFYDQFWLGKYMLQGLFVIWGVLLCITFLYGGHRVRQLVQSVPSGLLACGPLDTQHKGIMQLAMLAPYNNLASSVAAALVPTLLAPKIRITDENEQTFSFTSAEGSEIPRDVPSTSSAMPSTSRADNKLLEQSTRRSRHGAWQQQKRQRLPSDEDEEAAAQPSCSLLSSVPPSSSNSSPTTSENSKTAGTTTTTTAAGPVKLDFTLQSVLNHIALVSRNGDDSTGIGRKSQVQQVLRVTTATAVLGLILCIAELIRILGNYCLRSFLALLAEPLTPTWPWFIFQTTCRGLELAMGCAMAAVTKQPVVRPPQPFAPYALRPTPALYM